jgi:hypothetical protein
MRRSRARAGFAAFISTLERARAHTLVSEEKGGMFLVMALFGGSFSTGSFA